MKQYTAKNIRNVALAGHAGSGKTSLAEALLFYAGATDKRFYMDNLQLEENEYELVSYPQKGVCLYKCGGDRHLLSVHAPPHKERLFGSAGGR